LKLARIALITGLYVLILLVVNYSHMRFFPVNVIFFASLADAVLAAVITGLALFSLSFFRIIGSVEKLLLVTIWLLGGYAHAISVPTVIDRSLSFYILEKLQQRGGGIRQDAIQDVFIKEYLPEYRLVDVRLTEQLESGTIEIRDGCVKLTAKGDMMARLSGFYRQNVLPPQRLLMGEYTDALVNPFAKSVTDVDYLCH
jgi:hypothetical protein